MSQRSSQKNRKALNSGQGALGMGGQPSDDPRDIAGGGDGRTFEDRGSKTGPIPGAFGTGDGVSTGGGTAGNETVGPMGDKGITGGFGAASGSSRNRGKARGRSGGRNRQDVP